MMFVVAKPYELGHRSIFHKCKITLVVNYPRLLRRPRGFKREQVRSRYMAKILRDMTAEEQALYDADAQNHPWLKNITMTDDEMCERIDHYKHEGYTEERLFNHMFNLHYSWVYMAKFKHFLATGEWVYYDHDYIDIQTEYVVIDIMIADGASEETIKAVMDGKEKYQFRDYPHVSQEQTP